MQTTAKQSTDKVEIVSGKLFFVSKCWQKCWLTSIFSVFANPWYKINGSKAHTENFDDDVIFLSLKQKFEFN